MVLNNKVIQSVGSRAESTNAKVVDAVLTSSTKVLHSFINNQDQKNEQLIQKIALENSRLLEKMARVMTENRAGVSDQQPMSASKVPQETTTAANTDQEDKPTAMKITPAKPVNEKMRIHGSVKLPKR